MLWLICYDIPNDKRRTKLAKRLEAYCQRVQFSVFECPLETADLEDKLQRYWLPLLNLNEDHLRAYPLDGDARQRAKIYGGPPPYQPPDVIVL
ncbi:MAG: CRISPR-associated endonuclease Cas2 [Thermostichales cyanobacterium DRC_bins_46]